MARAGIFPGSDKKGKQPAGDLEQIAQVEAEITTAEASLHALEQQEVYVDTPAWRSIIEDLVPAEMQRVALEKCKLDPVGDPDHQIKQNIATGQFLQCQKFLAILPNIEYAIVVERERIHHLRLQKAQLQRALAKKQSKAEKNSR